MTIIEINNTTFSKEAIIAATYRYTKDFYIEIKDNCNITTVSFDRKGDVELNQKQFNNDLIDEQLRIDLNKKFGHIRDLIVEEAFKPVRLKK